MAAKTKTKADEKAPKKKLTVADKMRFILSTEALDAVVYEPVTLLTDREISELYKTAKQNYEDDLKDRAWEAQQEAARVEALVQARLKEQGKGVAK